VNGSDDRRALWRELLEDARWAPSPHNIQPWLLRCRDDGTAEVSIPTNRLLLDTDPGGLFTGSGVGCLVEALAVAARAHRLALTATPTGRLPGDPDPVVVLGLERADEHADERALLRERRTSRLPFDGSPVEAALLEELAALSVAAGHTWQASDDAVLVDWIVDLNRDTLFLDMADPTARAEVGHWLRFSNRDAARRRDGFSPEALGFPGWLLRLFFRRHTLLELPGIRHGARYLYGRTTTGTRTIAWLRGPFETFEDGVAAGRLLMRLWLTMTRDGVRLHPFGSVVTNATANARLQSRIEPGDGTLWLIMRLGRSAEPPRSHRREVDELVA
jgi:hypothetical protein